MSIGRGSPERQRVYDHGTEERYPRGRRIGERNNKGFHPRGSRGGGLLIIRVLINVVYQVSVTGRGVEKRTPVPRDKGSAVIPRGLERSGGLLPLARKREKKKRIGERKKRWKEGRGQRKGPRPEKESGGTFRRMSRGATTEEGRPARRNGK